MRKIVLLLALLTPLGALGQEVSPGPATVKRPLGLVVNADLGGGYRFGYGTYYTSGGLFEGELGVGYDISPNIRPELDLLLGLTPETFVGARLGVHYLLPDMPVFVRGALDLSAPRGVFALRWLLVGGGYEVRLTDALGAFGEADAGIPLGYDEGVPFMLRAGVDFRF